MSNNTPQKIVHWVKASERLPENDGQICVRIHGIDYSAAYVRTQKDGTRVICGMATQRSVWPNWKKILEWLEELAAPTEAPSLPVEPDYESRAHEGAGFDLKRFRALSIERAEKGFKTYKNVPITFWTTALAGELGELCNMIKKIERVNNGGIDVGSSYTAATITPEMIKEEFGGIFIYLDLLASLMGVNLEEAIIETFNEKSVKHNLPFIYHLQREEPAAKALPVGEVPAAMTAEQIYEANRPRFQDWGTLKQMCMASMQEYAMQETAAYFKELTTLQEKIKALQTEAGEYRKILEYLEPWPGMSERFPDTSNEIRTLLAKYAKGTQVQ